MPASATTAGDFEGEQGRKEAASHNLDSENGAHTEVWKGKPG